MTHRVHWTDRLVYAGVTVSILLAFAALERGPRGYDYLGASIILFTASAIGWTTKKIIREHT